MTLIVCQLNCEGNTIPEHGAQWLNIASPPSRSRINLCIVLLLSPGLAIMPPCTQMAVPVADLL